MKFLYTLVLALLIAGSSYAQYITEVLMPRYAHATGGIGGSQATSRVTYTCRLKLNGLNANTTYRGYGRFVIEADTSASNTIATGAGLYTVVNPVTGTFSRVTTATSFYTVAGRYLEFTTDATGSYTAWFVAESSNISSFSSGKIFFKVFLNNGAGGTATAIRMTAPSPIALMLFDTAPTYTGLNNNGSPIPNSPNGTAIRSTAAAAGTAKNFVMLYDNEAGTGRPVAGTVIEGDGAAHTAANGYAAFYANDVNEKDKTWGTIIPNNLAGGVKRIAQYSLTTGAEVGYKLSSDGNWAKGGGGTVSTAYASGGLTNVIVLDGSIVKLEIPVLMPQTITFGALAAKTYGDPDFALTATTSSNLVVSYNSSNPAVATIVNGQVHIVGAGITNITATQVGDNNYNAATPVLQTLTVNPAPLTVTANDATILQGGTIPVFSVGYNGFVNGEDITSLTTAATATTTATAASAPGNYPIIPAGATASNYVFTYVNGNLTINAAQQPQSITFTALPAKTYGNADFNAGAAASSGLALTYTSSDPLVATINSSGVIHITGAGTTTITVSQPGNAAFTAATPQIQTLSVSPAVLTITAEDKSRLFGQPNPILTAVYSGFVNGENNTVLSAQPSLSTTATTASAVGNYPITASGATAANYNITYVAGTLTVQPLPAQTITFNALPNKRYGEVDFAGGATATSGLPVTYTSSNTQVATIVGSNIHISGAGTADIMASQAGNAFNAAATPVVRTLSVQKANLQIKANNVEKKQGEANPALTVTYTGFVNGDSEASLTTKPVLSTLVTPQSFTGTYAIDVAGATSPNYQIGQIPGTLTVLPAGGPGETALNAFMSDATQLRVNYNATVAGSVTIQLFDINGNRLLEKKVSADKGSNTWYLDTANLRPGIYLLRLSGGSGQLKAKVFKG